LDGKVNIEQTTDFHIDPDTEQEFTAEERGVIVLMGLFQAITRRAISNDTPAEN
jgi:hypothetical protein